ncbi:MAG TPA: DsbA family protein [Phenylobacterium sp.]|uniref:DsbA family protein n=1 Tax=Phenylobacterium sp. TaxID=1871053 RepID=UPI002B4629D6|nr:DsbA family protein [Phenylobacterium sp.]HKR87397.1 DsbA family protein [Phenylobacterium sp.]
MKIASRAASSRVILALAAALALTGCHKSDDAFGKRVHAYLLEHPEVIREAAEKLREKDQIAEAKASSDTLAKYRNQLEHDPRDFVANPDGKITVVEFFDYRCGYCKLAAPQVLQLIKDHPDVRFVFKEFPIFGDLSDTAARIALTPQVKAKGLEIYKGWMAEKALTDASLDSHLKDLGIDAEAARKSATDPAIQRQLTDTRSLAAALKLEGTPAFIVGDTLVPGADMNAVRAAITVAKAGKLKTIS